MTKVTWKFWKWPSLIRDYQMRLLKIRMIADIYYNESKFITITELTKFSVD